MTELAVSPAGTTAEALTSAGLGPVGTPVGHVEVATYQVPMPETEADGTLTWSAVTAVVVEAHAQGRTGLGWTYDTGACADLIRDALAGVVEGRNALDVPGSSLAMVQACRNLGRPGVASCAISAVDIALWDLKARLLNVPLARLFGQAREAVPVYGSGGFVSYDHGTLVSELENWLALGCSAAKIKVGESWGTCEQRDLDRARTAQDVLGSAALFVDANGGYRPKQAIRMGRAFAEVGVRWFEEPVSSDDLAGLRLVRENVACDVAAGEYAYDLQYVAEMCTSGAVDCMQIDVTRVGGYTEWLRSAAVADSVGLEVSGHCAPALHVPVMLAAKNTRHLEYFVDHMRVERALFDNVPEVSGGALRADLGTPGHGMRLKSANAEQYRIS
jgi:L-alanine-DL-glutamate epimerase-like enolase superfamily enzyme